MFKILIRCKSKINNKDVGPMWHRYKCVWIMQIRMHKKIKCCVVELKLKENYITAIYTV